MRNYRLAHSLSLTLTFGHPRRLIPIEPPSSALAHQAPELVFIPMAFLSPPCSDLPNRKRRPPSIVDLDDLKFGRPVMSGFPSSVGNGTTKKRTLRRSFGGARWGPMWSNSLVSSLMRIARMYIQPNALAETESDILYNRERSYLSVRSDGAICASCGVRYFLGSSRSFQVLYCSFVLVSANDSLSPVFLRLPRVDIVAA
ncbi:hypothetical protein BHE74_00011363 [Ensete ventricosum]|nr:hypothetical protein BHE74_00011363 [Ensete ventricosum]